jgi:hypothetical protein
MSVNEITPLAELHEVTETEAKQRAYEDADNNLPYRYRSANKAEDGLHETYRSIKAQTSHEWPCPCLQEAGRVR